jgi:branched-chain amino acid transport system substrate-binding protein
MSGKANNGLSRRSALMLGAAAAAVGLPRFARGAEEPIRIGYGMALTGGLAPNGKSALLAQQIWEEEINAKGGLLGRPVKLVYYDDQSNPSTVPQIYTKLLDVDKVDLVIGGYATNMLAPAMPVVIGHNKVFVGLLGLAVNSQFNYPRYFVMAPTGGMDSKASITEGFFEVAAKQDPKPKTVAIVAADAEFALNAAAGARPHAKAIGLQSVYDKTYPPSTTDFTPVVRAIQAANPDVVCVCSYPPDSVGMVRAANEVGLKTKLFGGAMVGLQATAIKMQLGQLLNGIVNYDFWLPVPKMQFPGVNDLIKRYQEKAANAGVDPLGYYMAPWAYAQLQLMAQAIEATKSLDDAKLADYISKNTFHTVLGDVKYGPNGEWAEPRVIQVQFHDVKGNDLEQWRTLAAQTVVSPESYASGKVIYPFTDARG